MFRCAMQEIYKGGERLLTPIELVAITVLLIDSDDFNVLYLDHDFYKEFIGMPEESEKQAVEHFENEVYTRLQVRTELAEIITQQSLILKSDNFRVTCNTLFTKLRFETLAHRIICALENDSKNKLFFDTFNKNEDKMINYYEFFHLIQDKDKLDIDGISEFMYSDLEYYLDSDDTATFSLEDFAKFMMLYNHDIGVKFEHTSPEEDNSTPFNYVINPAKDCFKGVRNIFNSELAALAYCVQEFEKCTKDK